MRIRARSLCGLVTALVASSAAQALTINVDIGDDGLYAGTGAAPDPGTVWNEYDQLGGVMPGLVDSNGNATGVGFELEVTPSSQFNPASGIALSDAILLWASTPGQNEFYDFEITGLAPDTRYDVYAFGMFSGLDPAYASPDAPVPPAPVPDVSVFTEAGVSDASGTIRGAFVRVSVLAFGVAEGIQVHQVAVPEPALAWMLVPTLALALRRR